MTTATAIKVPTLGESVTEATVAKWFKNVGDAVNADEAIAELETDKVTVEVYAPVAGVMSDILVKQGESVAVGAVLGNVLAGAAAAVVKAAPANTNKVEAPVVAAAAVAAPQAVQAFPAAQKIAAENNVDTSGLSGSGKGGRVTKGDVLGAISGNTVATSISSSPTAGAPFPFITPAGPREERVKMSRLRQSIAKRLKEAQNTAAMLTTFNEVDMTAVMALRSQYKDQFEKKHGIKMGFMGFFVKAAIQALQEIPAVNAEIDGDEFIYKNYYDIGVAVGTDAGLVVPVVRDADTLSLAGVEQGIANLALKARNGKLAIDDMRGGTFTITNGGVYGSLMSTPILNAPQSGILGLHKVAKRAVVIGDSIEVRPMMYIALSYDHRVIDGKEAVTFLVRVKEAMEDPQRLLLGV
jgi:2-oxoglutarate dehydrogenase E2 component (dihydrolipoamide succinyltransferase)